MSMTPFGTWLAEIGLGNYADVFAANKIEFDVIHQMTDADLRELGLALGDRKRLLQAIARLHGQSTTEVVTSASAPAKAATESLSEAAVSHTAERRPLSVMFCDLIGSTALSARLDPEDLREVIRSYQTRVASTIQQFNGFIARYVGDGVVAGRLCGVTKVSTARWHGFVVWCVTTLGIFYLLTNALGGVVG